MIRLQKLHFILACALWDALPEGGERDQYPYPGYSPLESMTSKAGRNAAHKTVCSFHLTHVCFKNTWFNRCIYLARKRAAKMAPARENWNNAPINAV